MRIAGIRTQVVGAQWKNWVLVAVVSDDGAEGLGEATLGYTALPSEGAVRELAPLVVGVDAGDVTAVQETMATAWGSLRDVVHRTAMAAIETAVWDLRARSEGQPLWRALGGRTGSSTPVYANGWYRGSRDPDTIAELAEQTVRAGSGGLKFDPFGSVHGEISARELDRATEIVAAVRDRVGGAVELMVDAHDRFDVRTAIGVAERLEPFGLTFLEAPCDSSSVADLAAVATRSPVPIAAGERLDSVDDFARLGETTPIRIWQPESLTHGIAGMLRIDGIAGGVGASIVPHNARGPICTALNLHLCATGARFSGLEMFVDEAVPLARVVSRGMPTVVEGRIEPPTGSGLGIAIDWVAAEAHPYDPRHRLDFREEGWERRIPARGPGVDGRSKAVVWSSS